MTETETLEPETKPEPIEDGAVIFAMRAVVDIYGSDYVYQKDDPQARCVYRAGDEPSCLVGQVLYRLTPDYRPREVGVSSQRDELHEVGYSRAATYALQIAQTVQDRRHPWGAALTAAQAILEHPPAAW